MHVSPSPHLHQRLLSSSPPLSLLLMLFPLLFRAPTLPPQLSSLSLMSSSHLAPSPRFSQFPSPPYRPPPFLLSLLLPSFFAYVCRDPLRSSSIWAFTVCHFFSPSSPFIFLGPLELVTEIWVSFVFLKMFAPLAKNKKKSSNAQLQYILQCLCVSQEGRGAPGGLAT